MSVNHQSPQSGLPPFQYKVINTTTWGATANTCTITDPSVVSNSVIVAYVTGSTPAAGRWSYTITAGQIVISSTDSESSTLPVSYIVI